MWARSFFQVFVREISRRTSDDDLKAAIEGAAASRIVRFERPAEFFFGYAFFTFEDVAAANALIANPPSITLDGRKLRIERYVKGKKRAKDASGGGAEVKKAASVETTPPKRSAVVVKLADAENAGEVPKAPVGRTATMAVHELIARLPVVLLGQAAPAPSGAGGAAPKARVAQVKKAVRVAKSKPVVKAAPPKREPTAAAAAVQPFTGDGGAASPASVGSVIPPAVACVSSAAVAAAPVLPQYCETCEERCDTAGAMEAHLASADHKAAVRQARQEQEKAQALLARQRLEAMESHKATVKAKAQLYAAAGAPEERGVPCAACGKHNLAHFNFCGVSSTSALIAPGAVALAAAPVQPAAYVPFGANSNYDAAPAERVAAPRTVKALLEMAMLTEYADAFEQEGVTELGQVLDSKVFAEMKKFHRIKLDRLIKLA